ncbi:MAG: fibronectin type III domain-containing protein, partial [Mycobacterium sp.]|nr:fibronectin type III domain-containing protein [Mycobacterium sp.]
MSTGDVFTTAGTQGGTAGVGVVSATSFSVTSEMKPQSFTIKFGGTAGVGPTDCLLTGYDGAANPGPAQTGNSGTTHPTGPVYPAGVTTPLVSVSPLQFPSAAYVNLNASATVPQAPTGVTAAPGPIGSSYATVSWTAPPNGGSPITSYVITTHQGGTNDGTTWVGPVTSGSVVGLATGIPYTFTVSAINALGPGPESSPSNALTLKAAPVITSAASTTFVKGQLGTFTVTATGFPTVMH